MTWEEAECQKSIVAGYNNSTEQVPLGRRNEEHIERNMILYSQHNREVIDRAVTVTTEVRDMAMGKVREEQRGFRRGREYVDQIITFRCIIDRFMEK